MKKTILAMMLLASMALTATTASAETATGRELKVSLPGGEVRSFALSSGPVITFPCSEMRITCGDESASWLRSEISAMTFGDVTSGISLLTENPGLLTLSGCTAHAPGSTINVFSAAGIRILTAADSADLSRLAPGLYIVCAGSQSIKFIHK